MTNGQQAAQTMHDILHPLYVELLRAGRFEVAEHMRNLDGEWCACLAGASDRRAAFELKKAEMLEAIEKREDSRDL